MGRREREGGRRESEGRKNRSEKEEVKETKRIKKLGKKFIVPVYVTGKSELIFPGKKV